MPSATKEVGIDAGRLKAHHGSSQWRKSFTGIKNDKFVKNNDISLYM